MAAILISGSNALSAPDMCATLARATEISARVSGYPRQERSMLQGMAYKGSKITLEKSHKGSSKELEEYGLTNGPDTGFSTLGSDLTVVERYNGGTMHCSNVQYFEKRGNDVHAVQGLTDTDYVCDDDYAMAGRINDMPVMFTEADHYKNDGILITAFPWQNGKWGDPCEVTARFLQGLRIEQNICNGAACEGLANSAMEFAARYRRNESFRKTGIINTAPVLKELSSRSHPSQMNWLPTFDSSFPEVEITEKVVFSQMIDGKPYLVVVGTGFLRGGSEYHGYLVSFWQASGNSLSPVAGFPVEAFNSTLLSVEAGYKSKSGKK
jgi:hypothetical protein